MHDATFREIEILGSLMPQHVPPGTRIGNGNAIVERSCSAAEVLAQIDAAERDGVRTLLLVIESPGGEGRSGLGVYGAIRRFARSGGRTIAFVQGYCASVAPLVIAACDFVLCRKDAKIAIHASHGDPGTCARLDELYAALLQERTGMSVEKVRGFMAEVEVCCQMHDLGAVRLGWADWSPCTLEDARQLAGMLGQIPRGQRANLPDTLRQRQLSRSRPELDTSGVPAGACAGHQTASSDGAMPPFRTLRIDEALAIQAAVNWIARTIPAGTYRAVASKTTAGDTMFVAVGDASKGASSVDGVLWTARTLPGATIWRGVVWTGTYWIAVNYSNTGSDVASSTDGATWNLESNPAGHYTAVAWNGTILVAVGDNAGGARCMTSPTGLAGTWTSRTIPAGSFYAVAWTGTHFVAVGASLCATSSDGISWSAQTIPAGTYNAIAFDGTTLVAIGNYGLCATSIDDGVTWIAQTLPTAAGSKTFNSIAWGGVFCAIDSDNTAGIAGVALVSFDGVTWAHVALGLPATSYNAVCWGGDWGGGMFCAVGASTCATTLVPRGRV